MTQWTNFANHSDLSDLSDLYMVINNNTYNSDTCMKNVNDKMNDLSDNFKEYLQVNSYNIENNDFNLAFSVIKFWLVEYAYAHQKCNSEKSAKTFYKNEEEATESNNIAMEKLDEYYNTLRIKVNPEDFYKVKKQRVDEEGVDEKVDEGDNQNKVISEKLNAGNSNYKETFICSLELLKKYEKEIYTNYAKIKNIDEDLARKILIVKITRMLAYGRS
jgi:hypothetical protein